VSINHPKKEREREDWARATNKKFEIELKQFILLTPSLFYVTMTSMAWPHLTRSEGKHLSSMIILNFFSVGR